MKRPVEPQRTTSDSSKDSDDQVFKGRVVLVTGAGRGLGRAIAQAFAGCGAILAVNDLTPINLDETVRSIRSTGGRVQDYIYDIAKKTPVQSMVQQILAEWGKIDILINNAAVIPRAAILEMDEWDWHRTIDVNLGGAFFMIQVVGRVMQQQGGGVIVNIAASETWLEQLEERAAFIAGKSGLTGLSRAAARELAPHGIRVYAVSPAALENDPHRIEQTVQAILDCCAAPETRTDE